MGCCPLTGRKMGIVEWAPISVEAQACIGTARVGPILPGAPVNRRCRALQSMAIECPPMNIARFFLDRPVFAIVNFNRPIIAGTIAVSRFRSRSTAEIGPPTVTWGTT